MAASRTSWTDVADAEPAPPPPAPAPAAASNGPARSSYVPPHLRNRSSSAAGWRWWWLRDAHGGPVWSNDHSLTVGPRDLEVTRSSCNWSYFGLMLPWWTSIKCCNLHIERKCCAFSSYDHGSKVIVVLTLQ